MTRKQAQVRNWALFQLRGAIATTGNANRQFNSPDLAQAIELMRSVYFQFNRKKETHD